MTWLKKLAKDLTWVTEAVIIALWACTILFSGLLVMIWILGHIMKWLMP